MIAVIYRYRLFLLIAAVILAGLLIWFVFTREAPAEEPSRGVFVYGQEVLRLL